MTPPSTPAAGRRTLRPGVVLVVALLAAVLLVLAAGCAAAGPRPATDPAVSSPGDDVAVVPPSDAGQEADLAPPSGPLGVADGMLPGDSPVPVDADLPAVANLRPALRDAIEAASAAAQRDGAYFELTSGWRSTRYQEQLFVDGVAQYGSEEEARRYVSPPDVSSHVTGDAVDVGPFDGQTWLLEHGADHGLCRIYENERWHVELATTPGGTCPELLPDASAGWR